MGQNMRQENKENWGGKGEEPQVRDTEVMWCDEWGNKTQKNMRLQVIFGYLSVHLFIVLLATFPDNVTQCVNPVHRNVSVFQT